MAKSELKATDKYFGYLCPLNKINKKLSIDSNNGDLKEENDHEIENDECTRIPLLSSKVIIGRHPSCDIRINDSEVSRFNAIIYRHNEKTAQLIRLPRTNSLLINDRTIESTDTMSDGDILQINGKKFSFHILTTPQIVNVDKTYGRLIVMRGDLDGSSFPLKTTCCLIGSHDGCDVCLTSDGVAEYECFIHYQQDYCPYIIKLSKETKIYINEKELDDYTQLQSNDRLKIGNRCFRYESNIDGLRVDYNLHASNQKLIKNEIKNGNAEHHNDVDEDNHVETNELKKIEKVEQVKEQESKLISDLKDKNEDETSLIDQNNKDLSLINEEIEEIDDNENDTSITKNIDKEVSEVKEEVEEKHTGQLVDDTSSSSLNLCENVDSVDINTSAKNDEINNEAVNDTEMKENEDDVIDEDKNETKEDIDTQTPISEKPETQVDDEHDDNELIEIKGDETVEKVKETTDNTLINDLKDESIDEISLIKQTEKEVPDINDKEKEEKIDHLVENTSSPSLNLNEDRTNLNDDNDENSIVKQADEVSELSQEEKEPTGQLVDNSSVNLSEKVDDDVGKNIANSKKDEINSETVNDIEMEENEDDEIDTEKKETSKESIIIENAISKASEKVEIQVTNDDDEEELNELKTNETVESMKEEAKDTLKDEDSKDDNKDEINFTEQNDKEVSEISQEEKESEQKHTLQLVDNTSSSFVNLNKNNVEDDNKNTKKDEIDNDTVKDIEMKENDKNEDVIDTEKKVITKELIIVATPITRATRRRTGSAKPEIQLPESENKLEVRQTRSRSTPTPATPVSTRKTPAKRRNISREIPEETETIKEVEEEEKIAENKGERTSNASSTSTTKTTKATRATRSTNKVNEPKVTPPKRTRATQKEVTSNKKENVEGKEERKYNLRSRR